MSAPIAILALGLLFIVAFSMFGNELFYRKRVSMLGLISLICSVYLMFYLSDLNDDIKVLTEQLAKYQPVTLPKGE